MLVEFSGGVDHKDRIGSAELDTEAFQIYQKKLGKIGLVSPEVRAAIDDYDNLVRESSQNFSAPELISSVEE